MLVVAAALTACGGDDDADSAAVGDEPAAPATTVAAGAAATDADAGRLVVRTAELDVEVDDVAAATDQAIALARTAGGVLTAEESRRGDDPETRLVLRVPPQELDRVLDDLGRLGTVVERRQGAEDVTAQAVDLDSRIKTAETSVERLRTFLSQATTTADVAQLEAELTERETELEQLEAQRRQLAEQVDLATITLLLRERTEESAVEGIPGVGDALAAGWRALTAVTQIGLVVVAWLLPFLAVAAVIAVALVLVLRRRARRRDTRREPAGGGALPPPRR